MLITTTSQEMKSLDNPLDVECEKVTIPLGYKSKAVQRFEFVQVSTYKFSFRACMIRYNKTYNSG